MEEEEVSTSSDSDASDTNERARSSSSSMMIARINTLHESTTTADTLQELMDEIGDASELAPKIYRKLIRQLVLVWCQRDEPCRAIAHQTLSTLVVANSDTFSMVIKRCYLGFVSNSRRVNDDTAPLLLFMRQSFAHLCLIDANRSYQFAFIYIRQIAIHLRNAMIATGNNDLLYTVYNWQFIQCLYLWMEVIAAAAASNHSSNEKLTELAYPLTQIISGVARLSTSTKYYPLRIQCVKMLISLQQQVNIITPVFSILSDMLAKFDLTQLSKTRQNTSSTPNLCYLLRANTALLADQSYNHAVLCAICDSIDEYTSTIADSPAFADFIIPIIVTLKSYTKKCRIAKYSSRLRKTIDQLQAQATLKNNRTVKVDIVDD